MSARPKARSKNTAPNHNHVPSAASIQSLFDNTDSKISNMASSQSALKIFSGEPSPSFWPGFKVSAAWPCRPPRPALPCSPPKTELQAGGLGARRGS